MKYFRRSSVKNAANALIRCLVLNRLAKMPAKKCTWIFLLVASLLYANQSQANDWGFAFSNGLAFPDVGLYNQLEITYAEFDGNRSRSMREWGTGCRILSLDAKHIRDPKLAGYGGLVNAWGCGAGFSWRYIFNTGYFLGLELHYWHTEYYFRPRRFRSRHDSILPAVITGWRLGDRDFSFDIYGSLGADIAVSRSTGARVSPYGVFLWGIAFRF